MLETGVICKILKLKETLNNWGKDFANLYYTDFRNSVLWQHKC